MALMEYSQDVMQASTLERDRKSQSSSLKSLQEAAETRLLAPSPEGSAKEIHGASENRLPPCFIRASDGGLVTGSIIPPHTVFGPYKGTIKMKVSPEDEEIKESYDFKVRKADKSKPGPNFIQLLKAVDTIVNYSKIFVSIKPLLVTSNGELLIV